MRTTNLKQVGWSTDHGDMRSMFCKSTNDEAKWYPLYVDMSYTGTDHLTEDALRVKQIRKNANALSTGKTND